MNDRSDKHDILNDVERGLGSGNQIEQVHDGQPASNVTFAGRLQFLFQSHRKPDGSPYTLQEIAQATGGRVSLSNLTYMLHGKRTNPTMETLAALAAAFNVPPGYFFGDEQNDRYSASVDPQALDFLSNVYIAQVARMMQNLDDADKALVLRYVRGLRLTARNTIEPAPDLVQRKQDTST